MSNLVILSTSSFFLETSLNYTEAYTACHTGVKPATIPSMKISHGTRIGNLNTACGYGYATDRMLWSLRELGHEVNDNDPTAPVQIWFDQPSEWKWNDNQYRIGYHPWESTELQPGWVDLMNETDEIWSPSPLVAEWYVEAGVRVPVYTYEHGVDKVWTPKSRHVDDKFRFLHVGAEAVRKGGWETIKAFRAAFPNRDDVELTMKMINPGWNVPLFGKVKLHNARLSLQHMVTLFHDHHVFVYPSWGEGFGLNPLQALATGMPTITVPDWAPYRQQLDPRLEIEAELWNSPWPEVHPGKMFKPNLDDTVDKMRWVVDNYQSAQTYAHAQVPALTTEFDWLRITQEVFEALDYRVKTSFHGSR